MENLFQIVHILVGEGKVASLEATENEKININLEFNGGSPFLPLLYFAHHNLNA